MQEEKQAAMQMEINKFMEYLRSKTRYGDEVYDLAENDLQYGLTKEQVKRYLREDYDISQMKLFSGYLRGGGNEELLNLVGKYKIRADQMQIAINYYEKGIGLEQIEEVLKLGEIPVAMRKAFDKILETQEQARKASMSENEYAQELFRQIKEVVDKIAKQDEKYGELSTKLSELAANTADDEIRQKLTEQIETCEKTISNQQDQLNRANAAVVRLRTDNENKDREITRMERRINTLEERLVQLSAQKTQEVAETAKQPDFYGASKPDEDVKKPDDGIPAVPAGAIPVYYQVPVTDRQGNYIRHVPVERTARKSPGIAGFFAALGFKKKSRADIVKLVASGDLVPAQLVQIKSAIEKGLTESQLVELINNNVSAEKMKEIIEIAVLENSLG